MTYSPAVTKRSSSCLEHIRHSVIPALLTWAGLPQMASFLHIDQTTTLPSSCPPSDIKYLEFGENATACTFTLCKLNRANIDKDKKSHTMISAWSKENNFQFFNFEIDLIFKHKYSFLSVILRVNLPSRKHD